MTTTRVLTSLLLFACVSFTTAVVHAASALPEASPQDVGLSQERLDRISAMIQSDVDSRNIADSEMLYEVVDVLAD